MAWKMYAVRRGKTVGIVNTWAECQEMINGVSHAEFRGFNDEDDALEYLRTGKVAEPEQDIVVIPKPENGDSVNVFARGAFDGKRMDIGVVLEGQVQRYQFFGEIICHDYVNLKGFAGEMVAVMIAAQLCREIGFSKLNIVYSYDGIEKWADGSWNVRGELQNEYVSLLNNLRLSGLMTYSYTRGTRYSGIQGVADAERMVSRAKATSQYIDLGKVFHNQLTVRDVPLYSIS